MVTGDSVALRLMPAFESLSGPLGFHATDRTNIGCGLERGATAHRFSDGSNAPPSLDCRNGWPTDVAQDHPDVVFISLAGQVVGDWQINGQWLHPCQPAYDQWYEHQMVDALSLLTQRGARVALELPAPSFTPDFFARDECIRTAERQAATEVPGTYPVDFKDLICPQNHCINEIDGITLREDGMHYIGPAAELVVRWLVPRLRLVAAAPPPH